MVQRIGLITLVLFSFLTACTQPKEGAPPANRQGYNWMDDPESHANEAVCANSENFSSGIFGGQILDKDSWLAKGTVFILQSYSRDGEQHTSICTGSLIDRNMVLTAAHCVDRARNSLSRIAVYFTTEPECDSLHNRLESKRKHVASLRIHPNWDPDDSRTTDRGDIALLRLQSQAPKAYKPLKLSNEFVPLVPGVEVLVAGYGMANPNYYGDFGGPISLRVAKAPAISTEERELLSQVGDMPITEFANQPSNEMLYIDQTTGQGICGGDSGGPSLMRNSKGQFVVTGVASYVMNPQDPSLMCGYVAAHTSILFHRAWIEQAYMEMKTSDSSTEPLFQ